MSPNMQGALLMMGSMAAFTFNDTLVKLVGSELPLFQIIFLRGAMASVLIYGLTRHLGAMRVTLSRLDWSLIGIRSLSEVGATYLFLTALMAMPLANVTAVLQVLPLTVTLGAALFFRETVGWRRLVAILIGFCGMLLIVRPGSDGFSAGSIYALSAVACVTVRDLTTRRMSSEVPSMLVTLLGALSVTAFAGVASLGTQWVAVSLPQFSMLVAASVFILLAYTCSVMVMRVGEIGFVSPFRYSGLVWALVLGWIVFGDWPDAVTLLGAGIVVVTGMFTLYRERLSRVAMDQTSGEGVENTRRT
jgi:drug/metabolite transporter (DMT)-like permease